MFDKQRVKKVQETLNKRGAGLKVDGDFGNRTFSAIEDLLGLTIKVPESGFDAASFKELQNAHPLLQAVLVEARKEIAFRILDSTRGEADQNAAFARGTSKAKFGQSAHNYVPAVAVDLFPAPYKWDDKQAFLDLAKVMMRISKEKKISIRWGGDWNMDGSTKDGWDFPHYELHPWRNYAKELVK